MLIKFDREKENKKMVRIIKMGDKDLNENC